MENLHIKTVIFDLDDTLYNARYAYKKGREAVHNIISMQADIDADEFWKRLEANYNQIYQQALAGIIKWEVYRYLRFDVPLRGLVSNHEELAEKLSKTFIEELNSNMTLFDDVIETLDRLKELHVKCILLTNGPSHGQRVKITSCKLESHLDGIFISEEIGYAKPDKKAFDIALNSIDINRDETLMVGDSISCDINGAINAGIKPILIDRFDSYEDYTDTKINNLHELWEHL
jgi:HAD superfamily hydrolase (TIGR01549 family)